MNLVALSMRVEVLESQAERRDSIDQRWQNFMLACGYVPLLLPNNVELITAWLKTIKLKGILLTGGNSPLICGGNAPERDTVDQMLIEHAVRTKLPLLGVCRGMQSLLNYWGGKLEKVNGHVRQYHHIEFMGKERRINSYHEWGAFSVPTPLLTTARAQDGVIKAIRHKELPIEGCMWHPEREQPFDPLDIYWIRHFYESNHLVRGNG